MKFQSVFVIHFFVFCFVIKCIYMQICYDKNSLESPVDSENIFFAHVRLVEGDEILSIIYFMQAFN